MPNNFIIIKNIIRQAHIGWWRKIGSVEDGEKFINADGCIWCAHMFNDMPKI